jgi:hypothetical protein
VADVREERRLGAVEFGERVRAAPLVFNGGRVLNRRSDARRDQFQERIVVVVGTRRRVESDDEDAQRAGFGPRRDGNDARFDDLLIRGTGRHAGDGAHVERLRLAAFEHVFDRPRNVGRGGREAGCFRQRRAGAIREKKQCEGRVVGVFRQRYHGGGACGGDRLLHERVCGELRERAQPSRADDLRRDVVRGAKETADGARLVANRTVGERIKGFFEKRSAVHEEPHVVHEARLAGIEDLIRERSAEVPNLAPHLFRRPPERPAQGCFAVPSTCKYASL